MATDIKLDYLKDRISSKLPDILQILEKDFREELDNRVSILDISYEALKVNVYKGKSLTKAQLAAYDLVYSKLLNVVKDACKAKTVTSLEDPRFTKLFTQNKSVGAILVLSDNSSFLVAKNFEAIRTFTTKYISNNPALKNSRFGSLTQTYTKVEKTSAGRVIQSEVTTNRSKVDIGHIPTEDNENLQSPLESKIQEIISYASTSTSNIASERITNYANAALRELYDIQANISYNFKSTAPEAIASARNVLGSGYIVLTLHTQKKNNDFSVLEKRVYDKLVYELATICSDAANFPGSNTIIQDIPLGIINAISGNKKPIAPHNLQKGKLNAPLKLKPKSVGTGGNIKITLPPIRTTSGQFYSLTNLQMLLNAQLQDVISANMGNGNAKNILNYRTGRFAASVRVERLTQSREGMITAFYQYQKNPYQTFEPGFAQGSPKTRDPKLLISKSIREIAATKVDNRLRAVLV
jgi:hypothetical protein